MPTSPATHLAPIDLALVALYLVAITLFGLRFSKQSSGPSKSLKSYFLADNSIPWWAIALSIVSAETSTLTIVSIPGVAFAGNLGFLQIVLGYLLGRVVVSALFLPRYFRGEMLTAYQLIDRRFGHTLHKLTAGLFLLTRAAAEGVRVFAISIVVSRAIGTGDTLSIAIISALTLLYTFEGGMAAVIWTDVVQMCLYVAGTLVALFTLGAHVPGGWSHIHAVAAPLGKFHMLSFTFNLTTTYTFWAGILGGTFLTMASHGTDQLMVQRLLAARSLRESRLALLSSGAVIFLQFTLFLLIGIGLFVFYSAHPATFRTNDYIFPTFIVREMPHGIAGLLIAAILAAAMSNLSAALNSLASTTVIDFYLPFKHRAKLRVPHASTLRPRIEPPQAPTEPKNTTLVSRLSTLFWAVVLFLIAVYSIQHGGKGHVVETGLSIASVAYGSLLGVFLLGTLTKYATETGAILGMICGLTLNLALWLLPANSTSGLTYTTPTTTHYIAWSTFHVAFTWYVLIGALATFALGTLFSLILPKPGLRRNAALLVLLSLILPSFATPQANPRNIVVLSGGEAAVEKHALSSSKGPTVRPIAPQSYDFTPASALINASIAAHKLPGAVLLVGHNNQVVFERAYGLRRLPGEPTPDAYTAHTPTAASNAAVLANAGEPMTLDTIFDMASLTKVIVTTTAILQLVDQHKLDLDTPVAHYLPAFAPTTGSRDSPKKESVILSGGEAAVEGPAAPATSPTPSQAWKSQITIRQLLTHYSGLPEDVSLKDPWGLGKPDIAEGIRRAMASVPYGPPGQTFKYSDINFITLGALVETLTGQPLDVYARTHIFDLLGMRESAYHPFEKTCGPTIRSGAAIEPGPPPIGRIGIPCPAATWSPLATIPNTAPTAHDNEGTPATNPDYDHLLRGTVHDPTTRRMGGVAGHAGVFSTAEDMSRFAQALLDKLLHNTGSFPVSQATLQLATSPQAPATAHADATIFLPDGTPTKGVAQRGLGWDLNSAFSRPRGEIFPITASAAAGQPAHPGSFGHTGFTGTSLWIDPVSNTYVILLTNAIHPRGNPPISALRGAVATAVARTLGLTPTAGAPEPALSRSQGLASETWASSQTPPSASAKHERVILSEGTRSPIASAAVEGPAFASPPKNHRAPYIAPLPQASGSTTEAQSPSSIPPAKPVLLSEGTHGLTASAAVEEPALSLPKGPAFASAFTTPTLTGIDVLEQTQFAALRSFHHLAVLTNQSGLDRNGHRTIDLLAQNSHLTKIFTPEHGLSAKQDTEHLTAETDPTTNLPVISLYGAKPADRHPAHAQLANLDAVVIDLQDAGVHFWTYEAAAGYFLEAASTEATDYRHDLQIILLDRPNLVGGVATQGPVSDPGAESYVNYMPLPVRHGLTFGELAKYVVGEKHLQTHLTVIPMQNWTRTEYFADTQLPWTNPSPNLRSPEAATLYPALGLIEFTNISVGRGTEHPFSFFGAGSTSTTPAWFKAADVAQSLTARHIPGVTFAAATEHIGEDANHFPFHGQTIEAVRVTVTDRTALDTPELGIEILAVLHHLYPTQFKLALDKNLLCNAATLAALGANTDPRSIAATWTTPLASFRAATAPYLLYK